MANPTRVVVWFSCGATSAVAAKLALTQWGDTLPVHVVYCDPGSEHPDNHRFRRDVERWLGVTVEVIRSTKYRDTWQVFEERRYLSGVKGALCTVELKKNLRQQYEQLGEDIQVFGFDAGEAKRAARFRNTNPEVDLRTPLLERGLTKADCLALLERAGIAVPAMYGLGFTNANCIGCVKGGMGYWNKIRRHFPATFERMARLERTLNAALCKSYAGDGKRKRIFLDELDPEAGRPDEVMPDCSLLCVDVEAELAETESCET